MINYHRLISNAVVSVVQTVLSGLVLFFLYRYLIDNLGSDQLGLWSVILASTSVARLSDMGLTGSVVKFVARYRALKDDDRAADVIQTAAISIAGVMAVLAVILYPLLEVVLKLSIPAKSMPQALQILPWAVLSLWIGSIGGVFQSGLDGCQRMDIRNILMVAGNLLFFGAALWLVPHYGLTGLAVGQAAQSLLLAVASWLALRHQLRSLPWMPWRWSKTKFKEMFGYAVNFQINSIAILLFDPITKLLMSRYGGLSSAAYYEMASQLVLKLRGLLIAANQALVPAVAELHETSPDKVSDLYLKSYRMLFFINFPFYAVILISLPMISMMWIGRNENQFIVFGTLLAIGWGLNSLNATAYFVNLGTGDLKWNSIAHVVTAFVNVLLGFVFGPLYGGIGIAIGAMIALVIGSWFILYAVHRRYDISYGEIVPSEHCLLLAAVIFCIAVAVWVNSVNPWGLSAVASGVINLGVYAVVICAVVWVHPYRILILDKLAARK